LVNLVYKIPIPACRCYFLRFFEHTPHTKIDTSIDTAICRNFHSSPAAVSTYRFCWDLDHFTIAVLEKDTRISDTLRQTVQGLKLKGRPIRILHLDRFSGGGELEGIQLLYVTQPFAGQAARIHDAIAPSMPILLVTHSAEDPSRIMVNLYYDRHKRARLQLNQKNIRSHSLRVSKEILLAGGDEVGIAKLFDASLAQMKAQERKFAQYQQANRKLQEEKKRYRKELAELRKQLEEKNRALQTKERQLSATGKLLEQQQALLANRETRMQEVEAQLKKADRWRRNCSNCHANSGKSKTATGFWNKNSRKSDHWTTRSAGNRKPSRSMKGSYARNFPSFNSER